MDNPHISEKLCDSALYLYAWNFWPLPDTPLCISTSNLPSLSMSAIMGMLFPENEVAIAKGVLTLSLKTSHT